MKTRTQIFALTVLALSLFTSAPATPDDRGTPPPTTACSIRYKPALRLRPTPRRPIILTPPCQFWDRPGTPEPVKRFF